MAINFFNSLAVGTNVLYVDTLNDRVGIGTSTPDTGTNLHVLSGTSSGQIKLTSQANTQFQFYGDGNQDINYGQPPNFPLPGGDAIGQIRYSHGSNYMAFKVNNAEMVRFASNNKVGIGTTSPSNGKLQIDSTGNQISIETGTSGDGRLHIGHFSNGTFIGTYGDDGGAADIIRFGTHSGDERMRITSAGDVALYETLQFFDDSSTPSASSFIHRPSSNTLALGTNSSERMRIDSQGAVSVYNDFTIDNGSPEMYFKTGATHYRWMVAAQENVDAALEITPSTTVGGGTYSTPVAVFKATGNVGVGTTTPSQKLHVAGNVTADRYYGNGSTVYYVDPNDSTTAAVLAGGLEIGYGSAGEYRIEVGEGRTGNGYAYIDFVGDTTYSDYGLRLIRNNSGANTSSQLVHRGTGNLEFKTWDAGAMLFSTTNSERMRITSVGDVALYETLQFFDDSSTPSASSFIHRPSSNTLALGTNSSERFRIDSSGNFGFNAIPENSSGTWRNFQLGSLSMAGRSSDSNPDAMFGTNFKFTTANAEQRISAHATSRLFFNDDIITFQNAASGAADSAISWSERLRIDSSGNVQIGSGTRYGKFDILDVGGSGTNFIVGAGSNGDNYFTSGTSGIQVFRSGSTERLRIDSSGRVGIGTTSPGYELEVNGTAKADEFVSLVNASNSGITRDWTIIGTGDRGAGLQVNDISGAKYAIYAGGYDLTFGKHVSSNNTYTTAMGIYAANATDSSPYVQATHSLRAPIFYDSNSTTYYVDPASTSILRHVNFNNNGITAWYRSGGNAHQRADARLDSTDAARLHWYGKTDSGSNTGFRHAWYDGADYVHVTAQSDFVYFDRVSGTVSVQSDGSFRAPIFYDSNDTGYYLDPNSTSQSARLRGQIYIGPNTSSKYLRLGGNGGATDVSTISTSNGNLHIDATTGYNLYLAWYNTSDVMIGGQVQATRYYDRNNTAYYTDPASTSVMNTVTLNGDLTVAGSGTGILVDTGGHASVRLDRASTSYDNNLLFYTAGALKWRLWQDGTDNQLMIRDDVNSYNSVVFNAGGSSGYTTFNNPIRLGGTGTANELDDYEEGTWTATFGYANFGSVTSYAVSSFGGNSWTGRYVKIGRLVHCTFYFSCTSFPWSVNTTSQVFMLESSFPFVMDSTTKAVNGSYYTFPGFSSSGTSPAEVTGTIFPQQYSSTYGAGFVADRGFYSNFEGPDSDAFNIGPGPLWSIRGSFQYYTAS